MPRGLLLAALAALALLVRVSRLPDPMLPAVLGFGMALGIAFVWLDFGFTTAFRVLLTARDGRPLAASLVIPAIVAPVIIPLAMTGDAYSRFVAPIGVSLLVGAAMFGVGMQIANGCGSGTLVAAGQGSRRMALTLPAFAFGGVLGTLALPAALAWPSFGAIDLPDLFGTWRGLALTELLLGLCAVLLLRGARPAPAKLRAGLLIGALAAGLFVVSGEPWGITMGLTVAGGQALRALGWDLTHAPFWASDGARALLDAPLLAMHSALSDAGLLVGALLAAAARGRLRFGTAIGARAALGGVLGGLLMGFGARLSFGCNIGAFVSGAASGSLHGFVWLLAVLPGCWLGLRLRPWFG